MTNRFMRIAVSAAVLAVGFVSAPGAAQDVKKSRKAAGPLRVHPDNSRYFADGTKATDGSPRAVYLTGAHTWNNLVDMRRDDKEPAFDFDAYLGFLERHGHNFVRLWAWDSATWDTRANG